MSKYAATIKWQRNNEDFLGNNYSRVHTWQFNGGTEIAASASSHLVPLPWSCEENVDPEQAFVASLSSCHMLFYLSIASEQGIQVESYTDQAEGVMSKNPAGKMAISKITLRPRVTYSGSNIPEHKTEESMHHLAHDNCFIANSVNSQIEIDI